MSLPVTFLGIMSGADVLDIRLPILDPVDTGVDDDLRIELLLPYKRLFAWMYQKHLAYRAFQLEFKAAPTEVRASQAQDLKAEEYALNDFVYTFWVMVINDLQIDIDDIDFRTHHLAIRSGYQVVAAKTLAGESTPCIFFGYHRK